MVLEDKINCLEKAPNPQTLIVGQGLCVKTRQAFLILVEETTKHNFGEITPLDLHMLKSNKHATGL